MIRAYLKFQYWNHVENDFFPVYHQGVEVSAFPWIRFKGPSLLRKKTFRFVEGLNNLGSNSLSPDGTVVIGIDTTELNPSMQIYFKMSGHVSRLFSWKSVKEVDLNGNRGIFGIDQDIGSMSEPITFVLNATHFHKYGFVVISQTPDSSEVEQAVQIIENTRERIYREYTFATWGRAVMVGREPIMVQSPSPELMPTEWTNFDELLRPLARQIAQDFIAEYGDAFDYIAVFGEPNYGGGGFHLRVQQKVLNIGIQNTMDESAEFGSDGKLKAVGFSGNIYDCLSEYESYGEILTHQIYRIFHECIGHNYGITGLESLGITDWGHFADGTIIPSIKSSIMRATGANLDEESMTVQKIGYIGADYYSRFHRLWMYAAGIFPPQSVGDVVVLSPETYEAMLQTNEPVPADFTKFSMDEIIETWGGPREEID
jgi:hypothetical protein